MKSALKKGVIVKFKKPLNAEKAEARMIVLSESGGGRVLVGDVSDNKIAICLYTDELELCENGFQVQQ